MARIEVYFRTHSSAQFIVSDSVVHESLLCCLAFSTIFLIHSETPHHDYCMQTGGLIQCLLCSLLCGGLTGQQLGSNDWSNDFESMAFFKPDRPWVRAPPFDRVPGCIQHRV
jgi:hypothetical protein